jgi:hypothetical protein
MGYLGPLETRGSLGLLEFRVLGESQEMWVQKDLLG